jgi:outer membrane protein insertion porin family
LFNIPVTEKWSFKSVLGFHTGLSFITTQIGRYPGRVPEMEDANKLAVDGMFIARGWNNEYSNKGLSLWENWVELRFPIVQNMLAWDFFFDAAGVETMQGYYYGKNSEGKRNFTIENMRFSFGGGLRFTIPQFPLRFSLAKRFTVEDGNINWVRGSIFRTSSPNSGLDPVLSFTMSF